MAEFIGFVGEILAVDIYHLGAVAPAGVDVTLGWAVATTLVLAMSLRAIKRFKSAG